MSHTKPRYWDRSTALISPSLLQRCWYWMRPHGAVIEVSVTHLMDIVETNLYAFPAKEIDCKSALILSERCLLSSEKSAANSFIRV